MATTINGYPNDKTDGNPLSADEVNALGDGSELHHVNLCELFGTGVIGASDWNLGIVPGQIALTVTAGQGIVGDAGERKVCATTEQVTIDADQGLAAGSPTTYYVFKKRDLTDEDDPATGFVAQTSSTPPADSILIGTASMGASEAASVNNWPSGRVNLETVGTAWYDPSSFQFVVDCPPGEDRVFEVDFANKGAFGSAAYFITLNHDQDAAKTQVWVCEHGRTASKFRAIIQSAADAAAGTYGTSTQVLITCQLSGRLWTPNASPTAPTVTVASFAGDVDNSERNWDLPTGAVAQNFSRGVAVTDVSGALASGRLTLFATYLRAGQVITSISFCTGGTPIDTPTNQWFALYSSALAKLGVTADDTTTAWAANAVKTLALSSPYTVPTSGLYYVGIALAGAIMPSLRGQSTGANAVMHQAPNLSLNADSGLTNPASAPATATFASNSDAYAYTYMS